MTEYDYSPEAYERYLATQNRITNWVDKTEQHRAEFQSAVAGGPQDLSRSGPVSSSKPMRSSPSPPRRHHSDKPNQLVIHPPPPESDSSDSYYEGPWPPGPMPPQYPTQQPLLSPPLMSPTFITSSQRVSRHHRHRSHHHRRSHSQHSPAYYNLLSPPLSPGYQYPYPTSGGHQGYVMMPQTQVPLMSTPPRSAPPNVTTFSSTGHFITPNSQPCSPQMAWSTYGAAPSPAYSMMSSPAGTPLRSPYVVGVSPYQPFVVQQPTQSPYLLPPGTHQRVYDLNNLGNGSKQYFRRSVG